MKWELINFCENDKFAIKSYCAVHGVDESLNLGDITKVDLDNLPSDITLLTHGSPCQSFSIAGKMHGGDRGSGTRSSLMWNSVEIIERVKPKVVIWENVKNVLAKRNRKNFDLYISTLDGYGYNSYWQVLNARDYGIPQNRERIFVVSIRKDTDTGKFEFPMKKELKMRLRDLLEDEVEEKYYLSEEQVEKIKKSTFVSTHLRIQENDWASTLCARDWKDPKCVRVGGLFDDKDRTHNRGSIYDKNYLSPTLNTGGVVTGSRALRKSLR